MADRKSFAFVFPMASGHINPSLAVARALVEEGHEVHYLCRETFRQPIEDTGATFHSDVEYETELYAGREPDVLGAMESLKKEYGCQKDGIFSAFAKLNNMQVELMIPGMLRFLAKVNAAAVMYCPMMNAEAVIGAKVMGIPSIGLLTTAGPGSLSALFKEFLAIEQISEQTVHEVASSYEHNVAAVRRIKEQYGVEVPLSLSKPLGYMYQFDMSSFTVVTTSEDLQDPVGEELASKYEETQVRFEFVGPLLDKTGAARATAHKYKTAEEACAAVAAEHPDAYPSVQEVVAKVTEARAAGRRAVLVSMGTVVTGDNPHLGWNGRMPGPDGEPRGLSGKQLCRGTWGGAFDAFGSQVAEEGPLLVIALGPQPEPLAGLPVPPNAICMPSVPQVDLLRAGIDFFLTHGGQNSFTESMSCGTPVVVCPGFGDQIVNSRKAVSLGVGLKVDRPDPEVGDEAEAATAYRAACCQAMREVDADASFTAGARRIAENLRQAGGVRRAKELMLEAAQAASAVAACKAAAGEALAAPTRLTPAAAGA